VKTIVAAGTGVAGLVSAIANAGPYSLVGLGLLLLSVMTMVCWVVKSQTRTFNAAYLIAAVRGQPQDHRHDQANLENASDAEILARRDARR
jgi:hypothetical protein